MHCNYWTDYFNTTNKFSVNALPDFIFSYYGIYNRYMTVDNIECTWMSTVGKATLFKLVIRFKGTSGKDNGPERKCLKMNIKPIFTIGEFVRAMHCYLDGSMVWLEICLEWGTCWAIPSSPLSNCFHKLKAMLISSHNYFASYISRKIQ